jgi:hypothetical protein
MRPMQERAYERRGEQYLLIKSPPASGKSRALMFVALDKLHNQGLKQAIIVVPEKSIGASFNDEPLIKYGFWADWCVEPKWNLCNAPGSDNGGKVKSVEAFLQSGDKVLVCTHATFRFAVDQYGAEAFDDRLIAIDEFHHVSANPDNKLGFHLGQFMARDRVHVVAMSRHRLAPSGITQSCNPPPSDNFASAGPGSIFRISRSVSAMLVHSPLQRIVTNNYTNTIVQIPTDRAGRPRTIICQ